MKTVLSIAGSDCSGGAGIQADLKTCSALGVFGMSVIVAVVAENTSRVLDFENVSPALIVKQIEAVFEDIPVDAVKIGMLPSPACMRAVAGGLRRYRPRNVVLDPVMVAKNGCPLMEPSAAGALLETVLPLARLVTPNLPEAERLCGFPVRTEADMQKAAERIHRLGCQNVLVKGGHAAGDALDLLFDGERFFRYEAPRIPTKNTHGTGCTLSSAIAASLALGHPLPEAVGRAKRYVTTAIAHALELGHGNGPTHHFYELYRGGLKGVLSDDER